MPSSSASPAAPVRSRPRGSTWSIAWLRGDDRGHGLRNIRQQPWRRHGYGLQRPVVAFQHQHHIASAFDIVINVAPLFTYNPSLGDLLVDISMLNSPSTAQFDAGSGDDSDHAHL